MKIIQVVSQMEAGGAQKVAFLLTEGLRERGHDAELWFLYKKRPAYEENSHVRCFCSLRPSGSGWAALAAKIWRELIASEADVLIAHTHSANVFAAPIAAMAGVPVRVAVHHNSVETYSPMYRSADRAAFNLGSYSAMVSVSGAVQHSFAGHREGYTNRLHRIYNGIADAEKAASADIRAIYRIPERHALLVNVARLSKQKNQGMLLEMLTQIPEATLMLIGEGESGVALRLIADSLGVAERVRFTGELPNAKVAAILEKADLFLLPSLYESFCMAAVEAMQHGMAVIASDLPCLREVLGSEQLFFAQHDTNTLIAMVRRVLAKPLERAAMGIAGRARAENFSTQRMVGEYESLMTEALLYARKRKSATNDFRRVDALRRIPRVHDQL